MSRDRELVMEIEVAGRFFNDQKARLTLTPPTPAKPIVHFRRHSKWKDYMEGTVDGTSATSKDDLRYGFDWIGDDHYDFGKTDVLTERRGRYNFIYDNVFNSITDPDTNNVGGKVPIVMEDKNIDATETLASKISDYKNIFQQSAKLSTVHGKEYFPSWITIRQSNEAKLRLGLRNDNPSTGASAGPQFGNNDDTIHLIAEPGYENHFVIKPNEIKKADLASGEVEISVTCRTGVDKDVSILAYHTDINSARSASGKIDPAQDGIEVGELRVMKNDQKYMLDFILVKVQRTGGTDFPTAALGPLTNLADTEKRIGRAYEQSMVECDFTLKSLPGCLDATDASFSSGGSYKHEKYKEYINNKFLYEEYKASAGTRAVSFAHFESDRRSVRSRFAGTVQERFLLFIHDYANANKTGLNGSADSVEETHAADTGKWAVIYKNGSAGFDTAIHEAAHTMGLQHTFNSYNTKKAWYKEPAVSPNWQNVFIFPASPTTGNKGVFFVKRASHAKHLYNQGVTENIMDYSWYYEFSSNISDTKDFIDTPPPSGPYATTTIQYGAHPSYKNHYYKKSSTVFNTNDRISFYQWQWKLLQNDDEVVKRALALTLPVAPLKAITPPKLNIIAPTLNITKP